MLKYQRILLKLSGEALMGDSSDSVHPETVEFILKQVKEVVALGVKVGLVIGGGNFFRGVAGSDKLG
ncbi:MAG: UMP kinase, partial [Burkholderiales bacterium]|nr:UMP kinase [Burkholderiales bacterium]